MCIEISYPLSQPPTSPHCWCSYIILRQFIDPLLLWSCRQEAVWQGLTNQISINVSGAAHRWLLDLSDNAASTRFTQQINIPNEWPHVGMPSPNDTSLSRECRTTCHAFVWVYILHFFLLDLRIMPAPDFPSIIMVYGRTRVCIYVCIMVCALVCKNERLRIRTSVFLNAWKCLGTVI